MKSKLLTIDEALRNRGLWPEQARPVYSGDERRRWRAARRIQHESGHFARAALLMIDCLLDQAEHPDRIGLVDLRRDLRDCPMSTYLEWLDKYPRTAKALVWAGRRSGARVQWRLAEWLMREMHHAA